MAGSLESVLAGIPFIGGYEAQRQQNSRESLADVESASRLMQIIGAAQQQQEMRRKAQLMQQYQAGLRQDMTPEEQVAHAARFTNDPKDVLHYAGQQVVAKEAAKDRALQFSLNLQQRQDALDERKREFEAKTTDAKARQQFEEWYKRESLNLQAQNAQVGQMLRGLGLSIQQQGLGIQQQNLELKKGEAERREQDVKDKKVQQLGGALERANLPEADAVLKGVEEALGKTPELASYLSGPKSLLPDRLVPNDVAKGRQAFQKLFNITLKNRSGAAVTNPEFERLKQEFATGVWKKDDQLKEGVRQARQIINSHYKSVAAGFGSDTLRSYNKQTEEVGGVPIGGTGTGVKFLGFE